MGSNGALELLNGIETGQTNFPPLQVKVPSLLCGKGVFGAKPCGQVPCKMEKDGERTAIEKLKSKLICKLPFFVKSFFLC